MSQTTKQHVAALLENFADYANPDGVDDPWFTLAEINQQFAFEDIADETLVEWLGEMIEEGLVDTEDQEGEAVYRWRN
jgi:hypothetical protein